MLALDGASPEEVERATKRDSLGRTAVQRAWGQLSDPDKQWFHQACCLSSKDPRAMSVIIRFQSLILAEESR